MAADDFSLMPTWVENEPPEFHNVITQTEGFKKDYQNISVNAIEKFKLIYTGLSDANAKVLRDHYNARYGGYDSFAWKNAYIPTFLKNILGLTTEDLTGRWIDGSLSLRVRSSCYDAEIVFEREVT